VIQNNPPVLFGNILDLAPHNALVETLDIPSQTISARMTSPLLETGRLDKSAAGLDSTPQELGCFSIGGSRQSIVFAIYVDPAAMILEDGYHSRQMFFVL